MMWLLLCSFLVMLMIPALAFYYGGLVRRKNILSILMQIFAVFCVVVIQWVLVGYSLSFSQGNPIIGGFQFVGLNSVAGTDFAFVLFQALFAAIASCIIIGAVAERMRFSSMLLFTLLWTTLVYDPVSHLFWGDGGYFKDLGVLDFAGGTVVHVNSGVAGLVLCLLLGKRIGYDKKSMSVHNLPLVILGVGLLWFGWFGFNAGSTLTANGQAALASMNTLVATATAAIIWILIEWVHRGNPTALGLITGILSGLVGITPAAGFVTIMHGMIIGGVTSAICYYAIIILKHRLGYDDALDAFGIHGVGGICGGLLVGIFADPALSGVVGAIHGNFNQLYIQLYSLVVAILFCITITVFIYWLIKLISNPRVSTENEIMGLDLGEHQERAYTLLD